MTQDSPPQHILDPRRWTKALVALIVIYLALFVYKLLQNYAVLPAQGKTDGYDFMAFWSARSARYRSEMLHRETCS